MMKKKELIIEIEDLKGKLNELIKIKSFDNKQVFLLSNELDELINEYYKIASKV